MSSFETREANPFACLDLDGFAVAGLRPIRAGRSFTPNDAQPIDAHPIVRLEMFHNGGEHVFDDGACGAPSYEVVPVGDAGSGDRSRGRLVATAATAVTSRSFGG